MLIRNDDVLRARVPRERDVVELRIVLRDNGMTHVTVRACEKKYGTDPTEEEQCADEDEVIFLHKSPLP